MVGVGAGADVVGSAVVAATVAEVAARDAILKTHTHTHTSLKCQYYFSFLLIALRSRCYNNYYGLSYLK